MTPNTAASTTPEPTWGEAAQPTADELLTWVLAHDTTTDNTRLRWIFQRFLASSEIAERCIAADHAAYPAQVHRLRSQLAQAQRVHELARRRVVQLERYRLAWLSARRRARGAR